MWKTEIFHIKSAKISRDLVISKGIYTTVKWHLPVEVLNLSQKEQVLFREHPLMAENLLKRYEQIKNINVCYGNKESSLTPHEDTINLLRVSHLNNEGQKEFFKICRGHDGIFLREGQDLTFTNQVKHRIRTSNDISIYTESYWYPFIHKEEVSRQISDMLNQA